MKTLIPLTVSLGMLAAANAWAATRYVWQSSSSPAPPYTNWTSAAHVIQDAVDAALAGDEVVVTNGTYTTGGRAVGTNVLVNRVAVDKPLAVRSVNGPEFTIIQGYQVPGTTNGDGAIRCVYLTNGASLSGFTLTNGATRVCSSGFPWGETEGGGVWCESEAALVSNCILAGNSADTGGGGAYGGTLNNCTLTDNLAEFDGGGAYGATLNNCVLTGNKAGMGNKTGMGGGVLAGTLNNCSLTGNSAVIGGGAVNGILNNCTLTGNSAARAGGGVFDFYTGTSLNNCIVYFNSAPEAPNYSESYMNHCCTTPLPVRGSSNIDLDPKLADASHLSADSPCRGAGDAAYATGTDIEGEAWATPPSIGCDEYHAGTVTGPLSVAILTPYTKVAVGFPLNLTALIQGRATTSVWDLGDGLVASNQPYASHAWAASGDYAVILRAYNESHPEGVSATVMIHVAIDTHYVAAGNTNPFPPYTSWATAATNIQDAVDAALLPGALVLVTNGIYATGGRAVETSLLVNRVAVDKTLTLRSVNGPEFTAIQGYQLPGTTNGDGAIRCVYLANGASLSGFTLTNGATRSAGAWQLEQSGGGLLCESTNSVVSNCVIARNSAAEVGGGACQGTLNNCTLTGNSAIWFGGGAWGGALNDCTLNGNSASRGGGAYEGALNNCTLVGNRATGAESWSGGGGAYQATLNNCILYFNVAPDGPNYSWGRLNFCCTTPMPTNGVGNITNAPLFVDAAAGNYRLRPGSPCIDAGTNLSAIVTNDLDGRPRPVDGNGDGLAAFDIGAYEYRALLVWQSSPSPAPPYATWSTAATNIQDAVDAALVGDTVLVAGGVYATGGRAVGTNLLVNRVAIDPAITVESLMGPEVTIIQGYQVPGTTNGDGAIRCVYLADGASLSGFTLTHGATRTNGDYYVDQNGGGVWCESTNAVISNCLISGNSADYEGGGTYQGTLNYCTLSGNAAIGEYSRGGGTYGGALQNCILTGNSAWYGGGTAGTWDIPSTLSKCIVTDNSALAGGGGASGSTLNNCSLTRNSADFGGGAVDGTLNNCTLTGNSAVIGGGAVRGILNNCTLTGNSADIACGGATSFFGTCRLDNCIVYFNTAANEANYDPWTMADYCCTTPIPTNGVGSITNAPLFVDYAGGNLRLQSNSPCINAGNNNYVTSPTDLDGLPRIVSGTVDIGAYEFQGPGSVISYAWLQQYGLPTDGSADATDPDADGHTTWQEWRCLTDPTNALSVLRLLSAVPAGTSVTVSWQSVAGVSYFLERSTNLSAAPPFTLLSSNLPGQPGTTTYTDTNAAPLAPLFYRVGVVQ